MSYSFDTGDKKKRSAVEDARRERAERAARRGQSEAQTKICRAFQRHRVRVEAYRGLRERYDASIAAHFGTEQALKTLKLTPHLATLPPAVTTRHLVQLLLIFHGRKSNATVAGEDLGRLIKLSNLLSASITRSSTELNYAFLSCDTAKVTAWLHVTKRIVSLFVATLHELALRDPPLNRIGYGSMLKTLLEATDVKKWAFIRIQGKLPAEYTEQEQAVIRSLRRTSAALCKDLLRHLVYDTSFFDATAVFLARHVPASTGFGGACGAKDEDLLVSATLRLVDLTLGVGSHDAICRVLGSVPRLRGRMLPGSFLRIWVEPAVGGGRCTPKCFRALIRHAQQAAAAEADKLDRKRAADGSPCDPWPTKHLLGNLIEAGWAVLVHTDAAAQKSAASAEGGHGGNPLHTAPHASVPASGSLDPSEVKGTWVSAVTCLLHVLPSWEQIKRACEVDEGLSDQYALLWSHDGVQRLFSDLLEADDLASSAGSKQQQHRQQPATAVAVKKRGFFTRLRDRAAAAAAKPGKPAAAGGGESFLKGVRGASGRQVLAVVAVWAPPKWLPVCRLYLQLLRRWNARTVLVALAARSFLVVALWQYLEQHALLLDAVVSDSHPGAIPEATQDEVLQILLLFLNCYENFLPVCDDHEFYVLEQPFSLHSVVGIVVLLTKLAFRITWKLEHAPFSNIARHELLTRVKSSARALVVMLYDRNTRRAFCPPDTWMITEYRKSLGFDFNPRTVSADDAAVKKLLHDMPFLVSFSDRAQYLRKLVEKDRADHEMELLKFGITIRRDYLLEDALERISEFVAKCGPSGLRARLHVQFKNVEGLSEAGIDGGGVFKEFIELLSKKCFDPNLGLFKTTEDHKLYPSPDAFRVYSSKEARELYKFIGRVVAKSVYEGVVLNLPFAGFFLNTILGRPNYVEDLKTLDPELHKNLTALKDMDDVEDLCLTFAVEDNKFGTTVTTNLIPNGSEIAVTNDNLIQYFSCMAHMRLNRQFKEQSAAFISGFHDLLPPSWIGLFNRNELQELISGSSQSFEVADLKKHTKYAAGYSESDAVMRNFWAVLNDFNDEQKGKFLAFVTSSSKPPLLGFSHLQPPFCIRSATDGAQSFFGNIDRLPSASTCFNLLKLPPYKSKKDMKEKLLYAINAGAGFELS